MAEREGLTKVWGRRAISFPVYLVLGTSYLLGLPLWLIFAALIDGLRGQLRFPRMRAVGFFALYFVCELLGLTVALLIWLSTLGGLLCSERQWLAANETLQAWWSSALFLGSTRLFSMDVEIFGDRVQRGPVLMLVRHTSTADTALTAALVANPNRLRLRYVMKRELLWDPCLDVVGRRLPNAFLDRAARRRGDDVAAIAALAEGLGEGTGVLIYPEGTRFTPEKLADAMQKLEERGDQRLLDIARTYRSVLPPKIGGTIALLDATTAVPVVFVEHRGFEGAGSFAEFWQGGLIGKTVSVRLRHVAAADIPAEDREVWLFEQWSQLDDWLQT